MRRAFLLVGLSGAFALDNGLAVTPPMGWRSWNLYGANVNQALMTSIMAGMVDKSRTVDGKPTSLLDLGYSNVGLDDSASTQRRALTRGALDARARASRAAILRSPQTGRSAESTGRTATRSTPRRAARS